jgi:hypothetical protein
LRFVSTRGSLRVVYPNSTSDLNLSPEISRPFAATLE